jgi:hypothetical protein
MTSSLNQRRGRKRNESIATTNIQPLSFKDMLKDMAKETSVSTSQPKRTSMVNYL